MPGPNKYVPTCVSGPGDVAKWTSHPLEVRKTRVRTPPGFTVFRHNIAMLLSIIDLKCIVCVLKRRNKDNGPKYFSFKRILCTTDITST
jgi:hypothetical protein